MSSLCRLLFVFPVLTVLRVGIVSYGGRWSLPSEVRQRQSMLSYGVPHSLATSDRVVTAARRSGRMRVRLLSGRLETPRGHTLDMG